MCSIYAAKQVKPVATVSSSPLRPMLQASGRVCVCVFGVLETNYNNPCHTLRRLSRLEWIDHLCTLTLALGTTTPFCWSYSKPSPAWANEAGSARTPKRWTQRKSKRANELRLSCLSILCVPCKMHKLCSAVHSHAKSLCPSLAPAPNRGAQRSGNPVTGRFWPGSDVPFRKCDSFRSGHCCARARIE